MSEQPLVSIIIPTFNRAQLIGETLDSVLAQTYQNWECIVVDDGSTDGTEEFINTYLIKDSRLQYQKRPDTHLPGGNGARNYGFEISKGEYVQWFDSDDLMLPSMIETKMKYFETDTFDFVVAKGAEITLENETVPVVKWKLHAKDSLILNHITGNVIFGTNGPLFKRSFLKNKKLFNDKLIIKQEWEFFNRLLVEKPKVGIIHQHLYLYRVYATSKRKAYNFLKIQHAMKAHRETLKTMNSTLCLTKEEDIIYRKYVCSTILGHLKHVKKHGNGNDYIYLLVTFFNSLNRNFINNLFFKFIEKPHVMRNIIYLVFKK